MHNILIVCTGNICRSPIAAGLLRHHLPDTLKSRFEITSAGTFALQGQPAESYAVSAMKNISIDISEHRARQVTKEIARAANLILTMETAHTSIIKNLLGWRQNRPRRISEFKPQSDPMNIADPYGGQLEAYEECIETLLPCIKGLILWLGSNI